MSDYRKRAAYDHIVSQLHRSINFEKIMRLLAGEFDNIVDALTFLGTLDIYTAKGVWLDLFGEIIGRSRYVDLKLKYKYFGVEEGLAGENRDNIGGWGFPFYNPATGDALTETSRLNDDDYRLLLFAQIARNVGNNSHEGVTLSLQNMFQTEDVTVFNAGNAKYTVIIGNEASEIFRKVIASIDILPRAAGVGVDVVYMTPEDERIFGLGEALNDPVLMNKIGGFGCAFIDKYKVE